MSVTPSQERAQIGVHHPFGPLHVRPTEGAVLELSGILVT